MKGAKRMRKNWIIAGVVAVLAIVGVIVWLSINAAQTTTTNSSTNTPTNNTTDANAEADDSPFTNEVVTVTMKNSQFSPKTLTVKRGTTVKWVNEDTVRHNVVAANEDDKSGLPATNELFGKGGTYQFTFDTIGTFTYKCTPHPFMTGTIEVTE
jgi:plastocyanin